MEGSEVGGAACGCDRGRDGDVPMSSAKSRLEESDSGSKDGGDEGEPPGRPGWERRFTTSAPSRRGLWSCSARGICSELLKRVLEVGGFSVCVCVSVEVVVAVAVCGEHLLLALRSMVLVGAFPVVPTRVLWRRGFADGGVLW